MIHLLFHPFCKLLSFVGVAVLLFFLPFNPLLNIMNVTGNEYASFFERVGVFNTGVILFALGSISVAQVFDKTDRFFRLLFFIFGIGLLVVAFYILATRQNPLIIQFLPYIFLNGM